MTGIIQPSSSDIVGANLYVLEDAVTLSMDLKLIAPTETVLYYSSTVTAHKEKAVWSGVAKVHFGSLYFRQDCDTVCDDTGSRKQWRGSWAESDVQSPVPVIEQWLEKAETSGTYFTRPVVPAEQSDHLVGHTEQAYRLTWTETELNWKALCDAHPDTLFGGDELLSYFDQAEITMYFGKEDLLLDAILLTAVSENGGWFSFVITMAPAQTEPDTQYDGNVKRNILLREEWSIIYSYITGEEEDGPVE